MKKRYYFLIILILLLNISVINADVIIVDTGGSNNIITNRDILESNFYDDDIIIVNVTGDVVEGGGGDGGGGGIDNESQIDIKDVVITIDEKVALNDIQIITITTYDPNGNLLDPVKLNYSITPFNSKISNIYNESIIRLGKGVYKIKLDLLDEDINLNQQSAFNDVFGSYNFSLNVFDSFEQITVSKNFNIIKENAFQRILNTSKGFFTDLLDSIIKYWYVFLGLLLLLIIIIIIIVLKNIK